jgi:hypothetical protein
MRQPEPGPVRRPREDDRLMRNVLFGLAERPRTLPEVCDALNIGPRPAEALVSVIVSSAITSTIPPDPIIRCASVNLSARRTATRPQTPIAANAPMTKRARSTRTGNCIGRHPLRQGRLGREQPGPHHVQGDCMCGADACSAGGALLAQEPFAFRTVVTTGASAIKVRTPATAPPLVAWSLQPSPSEPSCHLSLLKSRPARSACSLRTDPLFGRLWSDGSESSLGH